MSDRIPINVAEKLREVVQQHAELSAQLLNPEVLTDHRKVTSLSIKKAAIESLVQEFEQYEASLQQEIELVELQQGEDEEMAQLAKDEFEQIQIHFQLTDRIIEKQLVNARRAIDWFNHS